MNKKYQRHGLRQTPEYLVWSNMKNRTSNPRCKEYVYYGGRRITVCDRWLNSFVNFYLDMGPRPTERHSIERIDNNKGYEPGNCKWATRSEQMINRRARTVAIDGRDYKISEIAKIAGTGISTVHRRLNQGFDGIRLLTRSRSYKSNLRNAAQLEPESKAASSAKTTSTTK